MGGGDRGEGGSGVFSRSGFGERLRGLKRRLHLACSIQLSTKSQSSGRGF